MEMGRFNFAQRHPIEPLLGQNRASKGPIHLKLHCYGPLVGHYRAVTGPLPYAQYVQTARTFFSALGALINDGLI